MARAWRSHPDHDAARRGGCCICGAPWPALRWEPRKANTFAARLTPAQRKARDKMKLQGRTPPAPPGEVWATCSEACQARMRKRHKTRGRDFQVLTDDEQNAITAGIRAFGKRYHNATQNGMPLDLAQWGSQDRRALFEMFFEIARDHLVEEGAAASALPRHRSDHPNPGLESRAPYSPKAGPDVPHDANPPADPQTDQGGRSVNRGFASPGGGVRSKSAALTEDLGGDDIPF